MTYQCRYDLFQDGAEKAENKKPKIAKAHPMHRLPKIGKLRSPDIECKKERR